MDVSLHGAAAASAFPDTTVTTPTARKSLLQCFEEARGRFTKEIAIPLTKKDPKRSTAINEFLGGAELDHLGRVCRDLSEQAEDKANNTASKLLTTLDQFKVVGDALLQFAPESVSIVWFGISSLITIGNVKVQTRFLICGTCDSIANIVADCIRWEAMAALMVNDHESQDSSIWENDIPDLVFMILDFLWSAKPHFDQNRVKRMGSTLKDLFTKELQQRVDALLDKYSVLVDEMQKQVHESMLQSSFKTGQALDQIQNNLQQYVSIGVNLVDSFQKQTLLYELDRQQAKLSHPVSYKLHFSTLNDRITKIIKDRNGRLVANWLFSEEAYCDWKESGSSAKGTNFLCLRGPRGHGKSVAMMSIHRDITKTASASEKPNSVINTRPPLVCHFFFKKGEQDIERARSALESILYQLLSCDELRRDLSVLTAIIDIISPSFGEATDSPVYAQGHGNPPSDFHESLKSLCNTIKMVAEAIPIPIYLMIDALDECTDRREQCLLEHLKSLIDENNAKTNPSKAVSSIQTMELRNLKLVISARDSIDVVGELTGAQNTETSDNTLPESIKIVDITSEKNSSDLKEYLTHEIGEVLTRRIDRTQYTRYYDSQLLRIVRIIHEKANGDFTLARLIIANLQQPSKDTLEKRIKRLPSAIGEIYMASLESLTSDEQEFVVTVLKWVVWSVSGLSILEISDHYKELYKGTHAGPGAGSISSGPEERHNENTKHPEDTQEIQDQENRSDEEVPEPCYENPYDDPEVKDTIYHIENSGRDFFKFDRNTGVVNVDISIREWVQQDISESNILLEDSRGFNKFIDTKGNTVFQFRLTPSFVRYGDTLSQLFSEKEAHKSIALSIFRTLNNEDFQRKYMPWKPSWALKFESQQTARYEIEHWHDHIKALQKWWTEDSLKDTWWAELLAQVSAFIKADTWYRWNLQRLPKLDDEDLGRFNSSSHIRESIDSENIAEVVYLHRVFEEPIHVACKFGLHLLINLIVQQARMPIPSSASERELDQSQAHKLTHLEVIKTQALIQDFLNARRGKYLKEKHHGALSKLVLDIGGDELINYLTTEANPEEVSSLIRSLTIGSDDPPLEKGIIVSVQEATQMGGMPTGLRVCDSEDIYGRTPLCLAKSNPLIVKQLLKYGANIDGKSLLHPDLPAPPLQTVLWAIPREPSSERALLLRSAELLILEGANLEGKEYGATYLHNAASIGDFKLFKLLCVSGDWNVHTVDDSGGTPLHWLFYYLRPKDPEALQEILSICRMILKMKGEDDLINLEDFQSRNAFSYAVEGQFVEAVELLISLGADIHDEDKTGQNCFHHLCPDPVITDTERNLKIDIADILLRAGLEVTKRDGRGNTPLFSALHYGSWDLARYFLQKYDELAENCQADGNANPLLTLGHGDTRTLFHAAADGTYKVYKPMSLCTAEFFKELNGVLSKYTDTSKLILRGDVLGRTALHYAIKDLNHKVVEMILTINPDTSLISQGLQSALDTAVSMVAREWAALGEGNSKTEGKFEAAIKVLLCISACSGSLSSKFPFGFFQECLNSEDSPFLKKKYDLPPHPEIQKVIGQYEAACEAEHGWSLSNYALAMGFEPPEWSRYSRQKHFETSPNGFARPTRIGWTSCPMRLSDDALEVSYIETMPNRYQILVSNHPLPPLNTSFYFEVTFSTKPPSFESSKIFCEIGIRSPNYSRPVISCDVYDGSFQVTNNTPCRSAETEIGGVPNPYLNSTAPCIGCGINPISRSIFLTLDGTIICTAIHDGYAVYYPFVGFSNYTGKCRINFGEERFMFEEANSTDWKWDGKKADKVCPESIPIWNHQFGDGRFEDEYL